MKIHVRRFYAPPENFSEGSVQLSADETRHLRNVLRLREGDSASVFDGEGREFLCTVETVAGKRAVLTLGQEISSSSPESPLDLTLATALLKGDKSDLVVQKAAELGVTRLQPLLTKRCDVKPGGGVNRERRWRKIALESIKQSGRAKLMEIGSIVSFKDFLDNVNDDLGRLILFTERDGSSFTKIKPGKKIIAVVGPEGGWEDSEMAAAREKGFALVTFGGRILRAETAAIAITTILQHRFGDLR